MVIVVLYEKPSKVLSVVAVYLEDKLFCRDS